jgi:exopolysaccharide production protein ExoZ
LQKLRSLQVMRAIAASGVVLLHSTSAEQGFYWGAAGVDLFFVISGFIIGTISEGQSPGQFLTRRALRIYPMWWLAVLPWFVALQFSHLPVNLTLWPIWGDRFMVPSLSIGWTLCFEMLFYFGTALALATRAWLPFAVLAIAAVAAQLHDNAFIQFVGNPIILEFLMGVAITRIPRLAGLAWVELAVGCLLLSMAPNFFDRATAIDASMSLWRTIQWGLPCALIIHGALSLETMFKGRFWTPFVFLGDASYSIYLFHLPVTFLSTLPWVATIALCLAIGSAIHQWVERPLHRRMVGLALPGRPIRPRIPDQGGELM